MDKDHELAPPSLATQSSASGALEGNLGLENTRLRVLQLQMIKAIIDSRSFKSLKSDEPRRVQVLDLYCLTRFESESPSRGIVY